MAAPTQRSFAGGIVSPSVWARTDQAKRVYGLLDALNFNVMRSGGLENRAAFEYAATTKGSGITRLMPFVFGGNDSAMLAWGDRTLRFLNEGAQIVATSGDAPAYSATKLYNVGDLVTSVGIYYYCIQAGLDKTPLTSADWWYPLTAVLSDALYEIPTPYEDTEVFELVATGYADVTFLFHPKHRPYALKRFGAVTWTLQPVDFLPPIAAPNGLTSTSTGAGTLRRFKVTAIKKGKLEQSLPASAAIAYTGPASGGSGSKVRVTTVNNMDVDEDVLVTAVFAIGATPDAAFEAALLGKVFNVGNATPDASGYLDLDTTEGVTVPSGGYAVMVLPLTIGGIANAPLASISSYGPTKDLVLDTLAAHNLADGDEIAIKAVLFSGVGTDQPEVRAALINKVFAVKVIDATHIIVVDTSGPTYTGGMDVLWCRAFIEDSGGAAGVGTGDVQLSWSPVPEALEYWVFKRFAGTYQFIARTPAPTYTDDNSPQESTAVSQDGPPHYTDPCRGPARNPRTATIYQQRLVLGGSLLEPATLKLSRSGDILNFSRSQPLLDNDAFDIPIIGSGVNLVRHLVPLSPLMVHTSADEIQIKGDGDGVVRWDAINADPRDAIGASTVQPLRVRNTALFVQAHGGLVHDFGYDLAAGGMKGRDLTAFCPSLFEGVNILQWCHQKTPHSIVYAVREDGDVVALTYLPEQGIEAWHRHNTDGDSFESIACAPESGGDFVYAVVNRTINPIYTYGAKYEPPAGMVGMGLGQIQPNNYAFRALHNNTGLPMIPSSSDVTGGNPSNVKIASTGSSVAIGSGVSHGGHGVFDGDVLTCTNVWATDADGVSDVTKINNAFKAAMLAQTFTVTGVTANTFELDGTTAITVPANQRLVFIKRGILANTPMMSGVARNVGANGHGKPAYGARGTLQTNKVLSGGGGVNIRITTATPPSVGKWIEVVDVDQSAGAPDPAFEALLEGNIYLVSEILAGTWFEITGTSGITVPASQRMDYYVRGTLPSWPGTLGTAVFDKALSGGAGGAEAAPATGFLPLVIDLEKLLPSGVTAWTDIATTVPFSVPLPDFTVAETGGRPALLLTAPLPPLRWQARTLQKWPSGFVKWAQVHAYVNPLSGTPTLDISATAGTGVSTGTDIISLSAGTYTITTGFVTATVKTGAFNLFDTVIVGVQTIVSTGTSVGVVGTMADGTTSLVVRTNATGAIEENGPAHAVLRIDGELASSAAPTVTVARFSCRFAASYHSPDIAVTFTIKNDKHHLNSAPSTDDNKHLQLGWVELETKIIPGTSRRAVCCNPGTQTDQALGGAGPADVYCYQAFSSAPTTDTGGVGGSYKPHILKDGGGAFTQKGWEKRDDGVVTVGGVGPSGNEASFPAHGYMNLSGALAGCTIAIRLMPYFWPASLGVNDNGTVRVGVFSRYNPDKYVFPWRMHESRQACFSFHQAASGSPGVAPPADVAKRLDFPATARLQDYSKYDVAGVFPYQLATLEQQQYVYDALSIVHTIAVGNETMQVVRFRNAANTGGENNSPQGETRLLDEYLRHGNGGQYFRGVDFGIYLAEWAIPRADDFADAADPGASNDGTLDHTTATFDDVNNNQHTYDENLLDAYLLTGDERLREALIDEADVLASVTYSVTGNERGNYQYFRAASLVAEFLEDENPTEAATLKAALKDRIADHSAQLIDVDVDTSGAGWDSATPGEGRRGYFASSTQNLGDKLPGENFVARGFVTSRLGPIAFKFARQYLTEADADGVTARGRGLDLAKFTKNEMLAVATGPHVPASMLGEKCLIKSYQITLQTPGADEVDVPDGFEHPNEHTVLIAAVEGWRETGNAAYITMGLEHIAAFVSDGHVTVLDSGLEVQDFVRAWIEYHGTDPGGGVGVGGIVLGDPDGGGDGGGGGGGGGTNANIKVTSNITPAANQRILVVDVTKTAGATQESFEVQLEAKPFIAVNVVPGVSFELKSTFNIVVPPSQVMDFILVTGDITYYTAEQTAAELLASFADDESMGMLACLHFTVQDLVTAGGSGTGIGLDDVLDTHTPTDQYQGMLNQLAEIGIAIGTYNKPTILEMMGECNGGHGYHRENFPGAYANAWVQIRASANAVTIDSFARCATAWNVIATTNDTSWDLWYPGDGFVDWCSIDVFNAESNFFEGTNTYNNILNYFAFADGRKKPIYIPEAGAVGTQMPDILADEDNGGESDDEARASAANAWAVWFKPFFDFIARNPIVKLVRWYEQDFTGSAYDAPPNLWKNSRVANNKFLLAKWLAKTREGNWIGSDQLSLLRLWRTNMGLSAEPQGPTTARYVERMRARRTGAVDYDVATDAFFGDSGGTVDGRKSEHPEWQAPTDITLTLSAGTTYTAGDHATLTANADLFAAGDVDHAGFRLVDPVTGGTTDVFVTAYTSATVVSVELQEDCEPRLADGFPATDWSRMINYVAGLLHLEGRICNVLGDGIRQPTAAVANGVLTAQKPFAVIQYGLRIGARFTALGNDSEDAPQRKAVTPQVSLLVEQSRGFTVGPDEDHQSDHTVSAATAEDGLETGWLTQSVHAATGKYAGSFTVIQADPLPVAVMAAIPETVFGGTGGGKP